MTSWEAFFLGIIQGITEFLPVSSSGHLALGQYFLGFESLQNYILFNLVCHLGTLAAIFYIFFPTIKECLTTNPKLFLKVCLGTLPLFPLLLILKPVKALYNQPELLGPCFLITSALIFISSSSWRFPLPTQIKREWKDPLAIGCFQALAIVPGISRSGATISAARLLGWQKEQAIQFAFLLAIPTIIGGAILEGWQVWQTPQQLHNISLTSFIVGFVTSCIVGCLSLWMLMRLVSTNKWSYFAWYTLFLGIAVTLYFMDLGH